MTPTVKIDTRRIKNWRTFHDVFKEAFGFPDFYGRNMSAWIDCLTSLDSPDDGMTTVHAPEEGVVVLELEHAGDFAERCPELYAAVVESAAFVNHRRLENGERAVLALSFHRNEPQ
jgi:RNAse (barnase) inhibitor barstar